MSKDKNAVPLPLVLEDLEERLLAFGFNLALEYQGLGFGMIKSVNYAIIKDFAQKYEFDSLELLSLYKEMIVEMESIN